VVISDHEFNIEVQELDLATRLCLLHRRPYWVCLDDFSVELTIVFVHCQETTTTILEHLVEVDRKLNHAMLLWFR
jgi:hypothetical protein